MQIGALWGPVVKFLNTNNRATVLSCNPAPGHISGKDKNLHSNRWMYPNISSAVTLFKPAKTWTQSKYLLTEDKLNIAKWERVREE